MTLSLEERAIVRAGKAITSRVNKVRRDKAKAARTPEKRNRGRERDNGFLAYLRRQSCEAEALGGCGGPMDPAHIRYNDGPHRLNPGGSRKNHDRHCNPLCRAHHDEQHKAEKYFWERLGKDAYETAACHYAAYQGVTDLDDRDGGYEGVAVVSPNDRRAA